MARLSCCVLVFLNLQLILTRYAEAKSPRQIDEEGILATLKSALKEVRPSGTNQTDGPVEVKINMFIRNISGIEEYTNKLELQLTFREEWVDDRLSFRNEKLKYIITLNTSEFWNPDLFFSNEKEGSRHNIMFPNRFMRIYPDGRVLYSERLSLSLFCPVNLKRYPFDTQICPLRMGSYGFSTDELVFRWKDDNPVQTVHNVSVNEFVLINVETEYCNSRTTTGEYSCLNAMLFFKRQTFYYYTHIYIPFLLLVVISWISFWLHPDAVFTRTALGVITTSVLLVETYGSDAFVAGLSYMTALDIWTATCFIFLLSALLEFIYVNYLYQLNILQEKEKSDETQDVEGKNKGLESQLNSLKFLYNKLPSHHQIDFYSRFAFPIAFALFNIVYWAAFL